jgi:plasmid stabilization system protein ParE
MTIVSFRPAAVRDLDAITDHIASDNPVRALTFADELLDASLSLEDLP